jgi:hypothetical protein
VSDPFDKSRCPFEVPEFTSEDQEHAWYASLDFDQKLEILWWMNVARYGEEAMNRPMDKSRIECLTMEEFCVRKQAELVEDEKWRAANGWPPRAPKLQA